MSTRLSLEVEANLDELRRVQQAVAEFGQEQDWSPNLAYQIELVIEELGINIINYGYDHEGAHRIEIILDSGSDALTLEIVDNGRAFDPCTEAPAPDLQSSVEDRSIGGLGIHLVNTMMDELHYRRAAGRNRLTLVKRRSE